jgi:hypothetical protein
MIWLLLFTLFGIWLVITEGNVFLRKKDDDGDHYHQSMD